MLILPPSPFPACPPADQPPVCGQCRRPLEADGDDWRHFDGTPRCPQGLADVVSALAMLATGTAWS
jgi:hypothetical protein